MSMNYNKTKGGGLKNTVQEYLDPQVLHQVYLKLDHLVGKTELWDFCRAGGCGVITSLNVVRNTGMT